MNSQHEELASLYVLDRLDASERAAFEARLLREPALVALVRELESTLAHSVRALPAAPPPPDLLARIEREVDDLPAASAPHRTASPARPPLSDFRSPISPARSPARLAGLFRWGLAAVIAVSLAILAVQSLRHSSTSPLIVFVGLDAQGSTLAELPLRQPTRDPDARFIQLASLAERFWEKPDQLPIKSSGPVDASRGYALFDPSSDQGFIAIEQLPALAPSQRYHLWLIDASSGEVRDAGTLPLAGTTRGLYSFSLASRAGEKPGQLQFLVTVEDTAATSRPSGKVVLGGARL